MRKISFTNTMLPSTNSSSKVKMTEMISTYILRTHDHKFVNEKASNVVVEKVNYNYRGWLKNNDNVVIINDSRQEVSRLGERGFITTSLILEECLQRNRGKQQYEHERNKFYVQDESVLPTASDHSKMYMLDLLWHMTEQDATAIEISQHFGDDSMPMTTFQSTRFRDIEKKLTKHYIQMYKEAMLPRYLEYQKELEADGNADYKATSPEFCLGDMECRQYDNGWDCIREFHKENYNRMVDDKDILAWEDWLTIYIEEEMKDHPLDRVSLIMEHFGVSNPTFDDEDILRLMKGYGYTNKMKDVCPSAFKRNEDWKLNCNNLVKAEALKLRLVLSGESFVE